MNKDSLILIAGIMLMVGSLIFGTFFYYKSEVNDCTSNPLVYASNLYENRFGYETEGTLLIKTPIDIEPLTLLFNSTTVTRRDGYFFNG